jgi:hypothetical protein
MSKEVKTLLNSLYDVKEFDETSFLDNSNPKINKLPRSLAYQSKSRWSRRQSRSI